MVVSVVSQHTERLGIGLSWRTVRKGESVVPSHLRMRCEGLSSSFALVPALAVVHNIAWATLEERAKSYKDTGWSPRPVACYAPSMSIPGGEVLEKAKSRETTDTVVRGSYIRFRQLRGASYPGY